MIDRKGQDINVLFDWDAVVRNPHSGFYTFGTNLISGLTALEENLSLTLFFQARYQGISKRFLTGLTECQRNRIRTRKCPFKFRWIERLWQLFPIPSLEALAGNHELYHCFHHFMPPRFSGLRILTVHDLRRYRLPHLYRRSNLLPFELAVKRADHFICVSNATKRDLCSIFQVNPKDVDVVHLACNPKVTGEKQSVRSENENFLKTSGIKCKRFLLAFSSKDRRKNVLSIARAFDLARESLPQGTALVIIGRLNREEKAKIESISMVYSVGEVDDVYSWLSQGYGLVFASLYEGFGLPILEAFSTRTPVITSNCSSMPEVAGDAALLVDPRDIREMAEAIKRLCLDEGLREELIERGSKRLKGFSWQKSAKQTLEVYRRLMKKRLAELTII